MTTEYAFFDFDSTGAARERLLFADDAGALDIDALAGFSARVRDTVAIIARSAASVDMRVIMLGGDEVLVSYDPELVPGARELCESWRVTAELLTRLSMSVGFGPSPALAWFELRREKALKEEA